MKHAASLHLPKLTFVVPVGPYHRHLIHRALEQVRAQTVPAEVVVVLDEERRGPATTRNRGVKLVKTPLIAFLDADDLLAPTFTEVMTAAWQPGHYVHCDFWMAGAVTVTGPDLILRPPNYYHPVVTSVLSKKLFDYVGGFDETLMGIEDSDLWLRCEDRGVCPIYVPQPLMTYERDGQVSLGIQGDRAHIDRWSTMLARHKYMSCCGKTSPSSLLTTPMNVPEADDILVQANWGGNREWAGKATGRRYPRTGNGKPVWVDKRDYERQKHRFIPVEVLPADADLTVSEIRDSA